MQRNRGLLLGALAALIIIGTVLVFVSGGEDGDDAEDVDATATQPTSEPAEGDPSDGESADPTPEPPAPTVTPTPTAVPAEPTSIPVGDRLGLFCADTRHQEVAEQNAASGIWVRGEVFGFDGGWVWVEGPSINNGDPVQLPIENGGFEGPLGINSYGEHPLDRLEIEGPASDPVSIDLLPLLDSGPGSVFEVTADEGPSLDQECTDMKALARRVFADGGQDDGTQEVEAATETPLPPTSDQDPFGVVDDFLTEFTDHHRAGDADALLRTLHPAIPDAFGTETCTDYVTGTTGSITAHELLLVGDRGPFVLDTPTGPIDFGDAIPYEVEFETFDGTTLVTQANLVFDGGEPRWLTRCGVE